MVFPKLMAYFGYITSSGLFNMPGVSVIQPTTPSRFLLKTASCRACVKVNKKHGNLPQQVKKFTSDPGEDKINKITVITTMFTIMQLVVANHLHILTVPTRLDHCSMVITAHYPALPILSKLTCIANIP